ncbi:hypothetical protein Tco_0885079, partial [Tanacetum coccineum]
MVAYLEKTDGNAEFHEIIDFLIRSSIHYALTVSLVVSTMFVEQFWIVAKSKTMNNVRYITAIVVGKPVSISEASIRSDLQFNDVTGINVNVTPLFPSMLAQPTEDEGAVSERPSETQPTPSPTHPSEDKSEPQPDPFLKPSSSNPIPDSILEGFGGNHGDLKAQIKQLKKKAKLVISHHNAWIKSVSMKKRLARKKSLKKKLMQKESVSKQGRKPAKSEPTIHKDPAFDDRDDGMDYMETEDAHDEGIVKKQESILTLKPLLKINPKDKGKKVLQEKAESDAESKGVNEAERKFAQLANDEEIAKKVQEEWEAEEEKKKLAEEEATKAALIRDYDDIQARIEADSILAARLQEEEREKFT